MWRGTDLMRDFRREGCGGAQAGHKAGQKNKNGGLRRMTIAEVKKCKRRTSSVLWTKR